MALMLCKNCLKQRTTENSSSSLSSSSKSSSKSNSSRTDLHVTEAWKNSNGGKGVVVAVIDSLIQWNHPDLRNSLYKVEAADKCPWRSLWMGFFPTKQQ